MAFALTGVPIAQISSSAPAGSDAPTHRLPKQVEGELLVRFRRGSSRADRARAHEWTGARRLRTFSVVQDLEQVRLPQGISVKEALALYRAHPDVVYAEPNYVVTALQSAQATPNDPFFGSLWGLHNTGQSSGTPDADIDAPEAWNITTGSSAVVVAVIDSGTDYTHPDLAANIFQNTADCNANGIDDDGNGYVDDCYGIDTVNGDSNPMDDNGHGTHTAGTIGAVGNNGAGVVGVNWNVRLMPCKFLDSTGSGPLSAALACLDYVKTMKDRGVNIVATNNSWGGGGYSQALYDAIEAQRQRGILFIAAAGNFSLNNDTFPTYPANYNLPNVISVAATTRTDALASFSHQGRRSVHLGAPGQSIVSTTPGNTYSTMSGTSMATPHVTGVAALLKAQDPSRDWRAIKNLILAGGDTIPSLTETITGKRLNAYGSLSCSNSIVTSRLLPTGSFVSATLNTPIPLRALNINCANPAGPINVTVNPGGSILTLVDDGTSGDQVAGDGVYAGQFTPTTIQNYTLTFPGGDVVAVGFPANYTVSTTTYNYRTIAGTNLNLYDDSAAPVTPPFQLQFGGIAVGSLYVGGNGVIGIGAAITDYVNAPLPDSMVQTVIAPFWDDFLPSGTQNVYWDVIGTAPNRELVIEWRDVPAWDCPTSTLKFQAVFFEGSSNILFNYADTVAGGSCAATDHGADGTVGVQVAPNRATVVSYLSPFIADGMALLWTIQPVSAGPVLSFIPNTADFGSVNVGGSVDRTLTIQNIGGSTLTGTATAAAPFSIVSGGTFNLASLASQSLVVRFHPTVAGPTGGTVNTTTNATNVSASLTGAGTMQPVTIVSGPDFGTISRGPLDGFVLSATGGDGNYVWSIAAGSLPPGISIRTDVPSSFPSDASAGLIGVATTPGTYTFTLRVTSAGVSVDKVCSLKITPLVFSDQDNVPDAFVGFPYSYSLSAAGNAGAVTWAATSGLPNGVTLDAQGVLSGTPTAPGFYNVNVTLSDGPDVLFRTIGIQVSAIKITTSSVLPNAIRNAPYNATVSAAGGSGGHTFAASGLPPGLSMSPSGAISGSAFALPGKYPVSVTATDSASLSYSKTMSIDVVSAAAALPSLTPYGGYLDDCTIGAPCQRNIGVYNGGTAPYTWNVTGLPPGMFIRTVAETSLQTWWMTPGDLLIGGAPTATGDYSLTVTVTDANARSTTQSYPLHVSSLWESNSLPNGTVGVSYNAPLRVIGGRGPYTGSLTAGALPAGVTFDAGLLRASGVPLESGSFAVGLQLADADNRTLLLTRYPFVSGPGGSTVSVNAAAFLPLPVGTPFAGQLFACCVASYVWTIDSGSLPAGLTLSAAGSITGTPTVVGTSTFRVRATDASNNANFGVRDVTLVVTPIAITTNVSLPVGRIGTLYNATLAASGGTGALTWSLGPFQSLPPGLTLNSSTGAITGTPVTSGSYIFTVNVADAASHAAALSFTLNVYDGDPPLLQSQGPDFGTWSRGQIEIALSATGGNGVYAWSMVDGALPPGLSVRTDGPSFFPTSASAGLIGVATTPGTYTFTLRVTSNGQTSDQVCTVKVVALSVTDGQLPDAFVGSAYNYQLHVQGNAGPVAWTPTSTLPAGLSLTSTGLLTGTPTTSGFAGVNFSLSDGSETVHSSVTFNVYALTVTTAGDLPNATQGTSYSATVTATGGAGGYSFFASNLPSGLSINSATGVISGTPNSGAGKFNVQLTVNDVSNNFYTKSMSLTVLGMPPVPPSVNPYGTTGVDDCTIGVPCSRGFGSFNGGAPPFTWTATGLPPGMSIRFSGGTVSWISPGDVELWGRPTAAGTFNVELTVTDGTGATATNTFPVKVSRIMSTSFLSNGTLGAPYAATLRVIGGSGSYTAVRTGGALPAGLTLNSGTLSLSGTPAESGFFGPRVTYTDSASETLNYTHSFTINGAGSGNIFINTGGDLGSTATGAAFSRTLNACCAAGITWTKTSGTLPPGLTLSSAGVLSGTPVLAGVYTFVVKAADSANGANYAARQFTLNVTLLTVTTGATLPFGNVGVAYSRTLAATGGTGALTWTLAPLNNFLPPGLSLSPAGVISGTPIASGQYVFTIIVTDASSRTNSRTFSLSIYCPTCAPPLFLDVGPSFGPMSIGRFTVQLAATGGVAPYHYSLTPGATIVPGMRVQDGAPLPTSFPSNVTGGYIGVLTAPGTYNTSIRVTDTAGATFDRAIAISVVGFNFISQTTPPKATVGTPYSFTIEVYPSAGNYSWSATGLPVGLSINASTGTISGTPTGNGGTSNATVTLTDVATSRSISQTLTLTVDKFAITTASLLPQGTVGLSYNAPLAAPNCGGTCTWTVGGALPNGLSLSTSGVISGIPTASFNGSVTINASGSNGSVQKRFALVIAGNTPAPLMITMGSSFANTVGTPITNALSAFGGTPPYVSWSVQSGSLPPGITLQGPGNTLGALLNPASMYLAGRVMVVGTYNFTLAVTDSANVTATLPITWNVSHLSNEYSSLPLPNTSLTYSAPYTQSLLALGGVPPYTWTATGPMPPGLNLSSNGLVSGAPTGVGAFSTPIQVSSSESAGALDATLNFSITGGRISGRVTNAATSAALAGVVIEFYDTGGRFVTSAFSDASGNYASAELTSGTYFARTYAVPGFIDQLFNGIPCAPCNVTTGTPIVVAAPSSTSNINFALATAGQIAGRVTNSGNGAALAYIDVNIYNASGEFVTYGFSDASGNYTSFAGLPSGTYYAVTYNESGFIDELYDNVQCGGACVPVQGTAITVIQGVTTTGIDFALTAGGRISGRVTNAAGGEALGNVEIAFYNSNNQQMTYAFSDPSGNYTTYSGLPTGTYYARTKNIYGYIDKVFNDIVCAGCDPTSGTAIAVTAGMTTANVDFALAAGGRISGRVIAAATGVPIADLAVQIFNAAGTLVTSGFADASGNYISDAGLASGSYFARTVNPFGFVNQLYNNIACASCGVTTGTPIAVTSPATSSGINFALVTTASIPTLTIADASATEGNSGTTNALFTVTMSAASAQTVTVAYATEDGDASAGSDYIAASGVLVFAPGQTVKQIAVGVKGDLVKEPNEKFRLGLSGANGALIGNAQAEGTIVNDDNADLSATPTTVNGGGTVTATFSGGPGNRGDWWGVYLVGAADGAYKSWGYLNGQQTMPASGLTDATLPIAMPSAAGTYEIRWWENNGLRLIAKSAPITVTVAAPATVTVTPSTIVGGNSVTATFTGGPGNRGDWWAVYLVGDPNTAYKSWGYLNGQQTMPASGLTDATLPLVMPSVAGTYEVRWWKNNDLQLIAKSGPITVTSAATVTVTPARVGGGDAVTTTFAGGPGNRGDWWGVYLVGAPDTAYLSWGYLNGQQTMPDTGLTGATLPIVMPAVAGTYEVRWWKNNDLVAIAKSGPITVATVVVTPASVATGGSVTTTFTNGPANPGDWWGVYLVGSPDTAYLSWGYLNGLQTMPSPGLSGATLSIAMPGVAGAYEVRWWRNNDLVPIAKSAPITVASAATVTAAPASVAAGAATTVTFAGGPGNRRDWWGVYLVGGADGDYKSWGYLNGLQTVPDTGLSGATLPIAMPGVPGTYEVRWWANGGLQLIAKSAPIVVTSAATVSATPSNVNAGDAVTATFANGPGKTGDWWGVYLVGDPDTAYKSWGYLNGSHTMPASGLPGATLPVATPMLPGTYELRWFENNSLTRVATSEQIVVTTSTP